MPKEILFGIKVMDHGDECATAISSSLFCGLTFASGCATAPRQDPARFSLLLGLGPELSVKRASNPNIIQDNSLTLCLSGGVEYAISDRSRIQTTLGNAQRRLKFYDSWNQLNNEFKLSSILLQANYAYALAPWLLLEAGFYYAHEMTDYASVFVSDTGSSDFQGWGFNTEDYGPLVGVSVRAPLMGMWSLFLDLRYLYSLAQHLGRIPGVGSSMGPLTRFKGHLGLWRL